MEAVTAPGIAKLASIAPQFLVDDLQRSCRDFHVEDPDGYILCFSEQTA